MMKRNKWYTQSLLDIPNWVLLLGTVIYLGGTYLKNLLKYGTVNVLAVLAIGGGVVVICLFTAYAVRFCFDAVHRRKGLLALLAGMVGFPLVALAMVYGLLPLVGVELQNKQVPFNWGEFMAKTFNAFFSVVLATLGYTFYYGKLLGNRREHELKQAATNREKELLETKNNLLLHAGQSHYVKHVMNDVVARAELAGDDYTAAQVTHIGKTFDYVADAAQDGEPVVSLHHALRYFNEVVESIQLRHGDDRVVSVHMEGEPTMQAIGALTLTTLLENSDTHGWVAADHPIRVGFVFAPGVMRFTCSNDKHPYRRSVASTGKGLRLVTQELALLDRCEVKLDVHESEESYTVSLKIDYS